MVMGYMFRHFDFIFVDSDTPIGFWNNFKTILYTFLNKFKLVFEPLEVSGYIRTERTDAGILNFWSQKARSAWHKYCQVSHQAEIKTDQKFHKMDLMDIADFEEMASQMEDEIKEMKRGKV